MKQIRFFYFFEKSRAPGGPRPLGPTRAGPGPSGLLGRPGPLGLLGRAGGPILASLNIHGVEKLNNLFVDNLGKSLIQQMLYRKMLPNLQLAQLCSDAKEYQTYMEIP